MAGGLYLPANHAFHSVRDEAPATSPESESGSYAVKEVPHPQLRVACGFWNTNPRRIKSS
jgi:hypothetical protein